MECVHYDSLYPKQRKLNLNLEIFKSHNELQVRNDLIDCQIDICSVDVPALFTENFDYQEIRKHFVRGILESDILGKTIYCHIISDKYAARVRSTQMYDSIR
jgi:translation initiation factor eIF-2B subunit epsilon